MKRVMIGAMFFLAGCTETRTTNEAQTTVRDVLNVTGQASGPGGMIFPVALRIERNGDTSTTEQAVSKTQLDSAAIAQQLASVLSKTIEAGMAKITGLQPNAGDSSLAGLLGAAGGGTGILYGIQQALAKREESQRHAATRKARDDLFEKSLDLAKKLPPESA